MMAKSKRRHLTEEEVAKIVQDRRDSETRRPKTIESAKIVKQHLKKYERAIQRYKAWGDEEGVAYREKKLRELMEEPSENMI
ncbi:MAG: hypothetical protein Q4A55_03275 [Aerococcus sp.]|nr:hypothetical protein [Aerococcus sp.]